MKSVLIDSNKVLSAKETKAILTPFAFKIDESLFGTPIAKPWKRAVAITIDLVLIAALSSIGGSVFFLAIAVLVYRYCGKADESGNSPLLKKKNKKLLAAKFISAIVAVFLVFDLVSPLYEKTIEPEVSSIGGYDDVVGSAGNDKVNDSVNGSVNEKLDVATAIVLAGFIIKVVSEADQQNCQNIDCWKEVFREVPGQVISLELDSGTSKELLLDVVDATKLEGKEKQALEVWMVNQIEVLSIKKTSPAENISHDENISMSDKPDQKENELLTFGQADLDKIRSGVRNTETIEESVTSEARSVGGQLSNSDLGLMRTANGLSNASQLDVAAAVEKVELVKKVRKDLSESKSSLKQDEPQPLLDWFNDTVEELGLGFGWAAVYFTVFTAWWQGKTPGKKLMKIKVLQLDGSNLSLWDSFGRYGGYVAGFATGLLGFLQVLWDPNRQAIHDKISATVVIDDSRIETQN